MIFEKAIYLSHYSFLEVNLGHPLINLDKAYYRIDNKPNYYYYY